MVDAVQVSVDGYRKDLEFITRLYGSASNVEQFAGAARAAEKVAAQAAKELQSVVSASESAITIRNVPQAFIWSSVRDMLTGLGIRPARVDKAPEWNLAVIYVLDEAERVDAIKKLTGLVVEGCTLQADAGAPGVEEMAALQAQRAGRGGASKGGDQE